jgi:hypothetical protein
VICDISTLLGNRAHFGGYTANFRGLGRLMLRPFGLFDNILRCIDAFVLTAINSSDLLLNAAFRPSLRRPQKRARPRTIL